MRTIVGVVVCILPLTRLKYLDQWLDNLSPAFLMPLLANGPGQVLQPLLGCLYSLIKPQPSANGQEAFRILGKLGGMNREFQHVVGAGKQPRYRNHLDSAVVVKLNWSPGSSSPSDGASGTGAGANGGAGAGAGDSQAPGSFEKRVEKFMQWAGAKRVRLGPGGSPSTSSDAGAASGTSGSHGTCLHVCSSGVLLLWEVGMDRRGVAVGVVIALRLRCPRFADGTLDLLSLDSVLTSINDILSTFFAAEKNISKDISTTLLVQPLIKTRTGVGSPGQKGSALEDLVSAVMVLVWVVGAVVDRAIACRRVCACCRVGMRVRPRFSRCPRPRGLLSQGGASAAIAPPSAGHDASSTVSGSESGADDSDVEEATATAALTSLYSPIHAKKVAWRALRDIIVETGVFDTSRQPTTADQDPSPGAYPPPTTSVPAPACNVPVPRAHPARAPLAA